MIKEYLKYLRNNPEHLWFKRKLYGWGWTPVSWQGWAVILFYILILIKIFEGIDQSSQSGSDTLFSTFLPFIVVTGILILICYKKGESPRWQWGIPKDDTGDKK